MRSVVNVMRSVTRILPMPSKTVPPERKTATETKTEAETSDTRQSSLYACPSCNTVYIASEKQTCSSCETAVEQVPATPNET